MALNPAARRSVRRLAGWTLAVLLAASGSAIAQSQTGPVQPAKPQDKATKQTGKPDEAVRASAAAPGLTIARDPATGVLRAPTDAEAAALAAPAPAATPAAVTQVVTPSGAIAAQVPEDMLTYTVVSKNPDGSIASVCLPDKQAAEATVRRLSAAPPPAMPNAARSRTAVRPAPGAPHE
jgi:hypothetical protein